MKAWQFWLLVALVGANLFITLKIALGLQAAQTSAAKIIDPIANAFSSLGFKL